MEGQTTEKIFTDSTSKKGLVCRIYKGLSKVRSEKKNQTIQLECELKTGREGQTFHWKGYVEGRDAHEKISSAPLALGKWKWKPQWDIICLLRWLK